MHNVVIDNINNGDIYTISCVLISGSVFEINSETEECSKQPQTIEAHTDKIVYKSQLNNKSFKILLELNLGENSVVVKCCCTQVVLKLKYNPNYRSATVLPLCVMFHDDVDVFESVHKQIETCTKVVQCTIAEKLYEQGYGRKTFSVENSTPFYSKISSDHAKHLCQSQLWGYLAREIMNSNIASKERKYLAFIFNTSGFNNGSTIKTPIALGIGGLALLGSVCLNSLPQHVFEFVPMLENNEVNNCCGKESKYCLSYSIGSVLHELCHTLGLGHTHYGIMGPEFHTIHKFFSANSYEYRNKENINIRLIASAYNEDTQYWTKSSYSLLAYHRWLNDYPFSSNHKLIFDHKNRALTSTAGLRVVELRTTNSELVLWSQIFTGRIRKFCFNVPCSVTDLQTQDSLIIVAEDDAGNIIKQSVGEFLNQWQWARFSLLM